MKKILTVLFLITFVGAQSQNISGEITYDIDFIKIPMDTAQSSFSSENSRNATLRLYNNFKREAEGKHPIMKLIFDEIESIYEAIPRLNNDAQHSVLMEIELKNHFYVNRLTNFSFSQSKIFGTLYRIKKPMRKDWKITNESKKIAGYLCYKATIKEDLGKKGNPITVIAWFAPHIPFGYGPAGYGELPGVILELRKSGISYNALEIKLKDKSITIEMPTEGKLVTQKYIKNMFMGVIEE